MMSLRKLSWERACEVLWKTWKGRWCLERKLSWTLQTVRGRSCIEMPHWAPLGSSGLCWAPLTMPLLWGSSLHREKCAKELLRVFRLILAASAESYRFSRALQFRLDRATSASSCLVFAIGLNYWYLDSEKQKCSKELLLNKFKTPFSY